MKHIASAVGFVLALGPIAAAAGEQATLKVDGTIMPSSCDVSVRDGALDLGHIHLADLNPVETEETHLVDRENELEVRCGGPVRFALGASDQATGGGNGREHFGLGLGSNGKPVGSLVVSERPDGFNADGKRAYLTASDDLQAWTASSTGPMPFMQNDTLLGLTRTAGSISGPDLVQSATFWLSIGVYIAPKVDLVIGDELSLAGHVSFEIRYL